MGLPAPLGVDSPTSPAAAQWLDVRVIYVRICAPAISQSQAPEILVFRCNPREIRSELEVNGARIPLSEAAPLTLRLDRVDDDTSEAMYVSTDKIRLSLSLPFSITHGEEQLADGLVSCREGLTSRWNAGSEMGLRDWNAEGFREGSEPRVPEWGMRVNCTASPGWGGFTIKSMQDFTTVQPVQPSLEVCLVGKCCGAPVMVADAVQMLPRKRSNWNCSLDAIPEAGDAEKWALAERPEDAEGKNFRPSEFNGEGERPPPSMIDRYWNGHGSIESLYGGEESSEGEMSWFNAGVRVGVGIGLGMCIGVGIGVGLMVRTYQATTRPFRGRML